MNFEEVLEIKKKLNSGDYVTIKQIVGCSLSTVRQHFIGARNHNSPTGQRITEAAKRLIKSRDQIAKEMKSEGNDV